MAKQKRTKKELEDLRQKARNLFVHQGKTQKEVAGILEVTEATISDWANNGKEGSWKDARKARQSSTATASENIHRIISLLSAQRIDIEMQINEAMDAGDNMREIELRKLANNISDDMSKQKSTLAEITKNGKAFITLGDFIDIMDEIFGELKVYNRKAYENTIDFQMYLARKKAMELN